jgi:hypothetical protein
MGDLKSTVEPLAVRLPNNEFILGIEDNGWVVGRRDCDWQQLDLSPFPFPHPLKSAPRTIFKDIKGHASKNYGIPWLEMPLNVELVDPYLVGLTNNGIEVRTMDKVSRLVQTIELQKATHLCMGTSLFVASATSCWVLQPVPIPEQVESLVSLEEFAFASKLAVREGWGGGGENSHVASPPGTHARRGAAEQASDWNQSAVRPLRVPEKALCASPHSHAGAGQRACALGLHPPSPPPAETGLSGAQIIPLAVAE